METLRILGIFRVVAIHVGSHIGQEDATTIVSIDLTQHLLLQSLDDCMFSEDGQSVDGRMIDWITS